MTAFNRIIAISLFVCCLVNCSSKKTNTGTPKNASTSTPKFTDGGKTMDSLKLVYQAESIEYENWEDNDLNDSTLTVCLINSRILLPQKPDSNYIQLGNIARQIDRVVSTPESYQSYNIIFVKLDTLNGIITEAQNYNFKISKKQL